MTAKCSFIIARASKLVRPVSLSAPNLSAATVGCALLAEIGAIYASAFIWRVV